MLTPTSGAVHRVASSIDLVARSAVRASATTERAGQDFQEAGVANPDGTDPDRRWAVSADSPSAPTSSRSLNQRVKSDLAEPRRLFADGRSAGGSERALTESEALRWYDSVSRAVDPVSVRHADDSHRVGSVDEFNPSQELVWTRVSANTGNKVAMYNLAKFYELGENVERDYRMATYWYRMRGEAHVVAPR